MTERKLLLRRGLTESTAELGTVEKRIVTESTLAANLVDDRSLDFAAVHTEHPPTLYQSDRADKARRPILHAAQFLQQQSIV